AILPSILAEGENAFMLAGEQGLATGSGLLIMLYGGRLLINQFIRAFQGISEKLHPGAKQAFDVPVLFNYRPNAVIIGFIIAMITSSLLIIIAQSFYVFGVVTIPLVVTSFFEMGGAAIVGEGQGGVRGAIIGTTVSAVVMVLLVGVSASIYSDTIQNWILVFGGNDLSLFGIIAKWIGDLFIGVFG